MLDLRSKDPLSPLAVVVDLFLVVLSSLLLFFAVTAGFTRFSFFGIGNPDVCLENVRGLGSLVSHTASVTGLRSDANASLYSVTVCNTKPGFTGEVLAGLSNAPATLVLLGFLIYLRRSISVARRAGLFTHELARRIQLLGGTLIIGIVVAAGIQYVAGAALLRTMVSGASWLDGRVELSVTGLVAGFGLLTVGLILQRAVALQEDADSTI